MAKRINKEAAHINPCLKEQEQSYQCLNKNNFDQQKCALYFDNYNICKKFWGEVYKDRKSKGIIPYLPNLEDRERIKEEYKSRTQFKLS